MQASDEAFPIEEVLQRNRVRAELYFEKWANCQEDDSRSVSASPFGRIWNVPERSESASATTSNSTGPQVNQSSTITKSTQSRSSGKTLPREESSTSQQDTPTPDMSHLFENVGQCVTEAIMEQGAVPMLDLKEALSKVLPPDTVSRLYSVNNAGPIRFV